MSRTLRVIVVGVVRVVGVVGLGAALVAAGGCKKTAPPPGAAGGGEAAKPGGEAPAEPPPVVGMEDPFARLTSDGAKSLNAGYKALKAKKYDEARAAFEAVSKATPDHSASRFQAVRAAALGGQLADVPAMWKDLLARDYVAYAGKLDKPKDLTPLRAAPEWAKVKEVESRMRSAYAASLDKGVFFVARDRDVPPPKFDGAEAQAKLDLRQELYYFDPANGRYRRLTDTDGHVFAMNVAPTRKYISVLVATKLEHQAATGEDEFLDPQGAVIDLATLEVTGPFKLARNATSVTLGWNDKGEPLWVLGATEEGGPTGYTLDATRTAMVSVPAGKESTTGPHTTVARPGSVSHQGSATAGAKRGDDGKSVVVEGSDKPLRSAREIAADSLEWSPGKKRLVYAGVLDACKLLKAGGKADKDDKNELFLWDAEKKVASRVAAAVSGFDTHWLDDDHLVYEGGIGKEGKLHVYEVSTRKDTVLKPRFGAGLYGYPSLTCAEPEPEARPNAQPPGDEPYPEDMPDGD